MEVELENKGYDAELEGSEVDSFFWYKVIFQKWVGWVTFLPIGGLVMLMFPLVFRYRIENKREMRALFKKLTKSGKPILICANHMTYVDSLLIHWAFGSHLWYFLNFRFFSWNLPAVEYQRSNVFFRFIGYIGKCIFIDRKGQKSHHQKILSTIRGLLINGEVVTIFPEGRRSRSGFFEHERLTYGVGKVITSLPKTNVLCVYLRSHLQRQSSAFPPRYSRFRVHAQVLEPQILSNGRQARAEVVSQIGNTISGLEKIYFQKSKS